MTRGNGFKPWSRGDTRRAEGSGESGWETDHVSMGTSTHHVVYNDSFGPVPERRVGRLDATNVLVHSQISRRPTVIRAALDRFSAGSSWLRLKPVSLSNLPP